MGNNCPNRSWTDFRAHRVHGSQLWIGSGGTIDPKKQMVFSRKLDSLPAFGERFALLPMPHDAFWGGRYGIVLDPDLNRVGLMGPIDPKRSFTPTV